jgi:hypothetical protein
MYSWTTIRTIAGLLLLIPLAHLAYLMSSETEATLDSSPQIWAAEVEAYERADRVMQLPSSPLVVVGARRVSLWRGLDDLLAPFPVLMRGLGNATINDISYYYERLIGHYSPGAVAILPDISEFHIRDNKSPRELAAAIRELAQTNLEHEVTRFVYVFPPLKTPRYPGDTASIDRTTELLQAWAQQEDRVHILDANALLDNQRGQPRPFYFHHDGVRLNEYGYVRLGVMLRTAVERDYPHIFAAR